MNLVSIRQGFATNSSSMHSIIWDNSQLTTEWDEFGWGRFIVGCREGKQKYLATSLKEAVSNHINTGVWDLDDRLAEIAVKQIFGVEPGDYIDHNSAISWPTVWSGEHIDYEFFKEFAEYVSGHSGISIRGGNDNDDWDSPFYDTEPAFDSGNTQVFPYGRVRKDRHAWVFFHSKNGNKNRITFSDEPYEYSATPELVDLKITDYCNYGCSFCYQDSTVEGKHADLNVIAEIINQLAKAKCFEIAIGGGEPTQHTDFIEVLRLAKSKHIVPNFTTFNLSWMDEDKELCRAVNEFCGGFAVSCLTPKSLERIAAWNKENKVKANLQIPCGCYPDDKVKAAIDFCNGNRIGLTLLGFKTSGRGKDFDPTSYEWMLDYCKDKDRLRFGVDTLFVNQFSEKLKDLGVDDRLMVGSEGRFSCYIDAVDETISAHSYGCKLKRKKLKVENSKYWARVSNLLEHFPFLGDETIDGR